MDREPSLRTILGDTGGAFTIGALGGSVYHFTKGLSNSPNGSRIAGGMEAMKLNVPRIAGGFAVWGGLLSTCDFALVYVRKKEDPWNSIISGAAASGILSVRQGFGVVVRSSMQGAVLMALMSGMGLTAQRHTHQNTNISVPATSPVISPVESSSDDGSFGGLFEGRKVKDGSANRNNKNDTWNF